MVLEQLAGAVNLWGVFVQGKFRGTFSSVTSLFDAKHKASPVEHQNIGRYSQYMIT